MRYDSEHKQRTHLRVIQEAAVLIRKFGPDKIGVAGLMEKVGLTHGGFYAHFKSKNELLDAAVNHMFEDRFSAFEQSLVDIEPAEGLSRYIDFYLSTEHKNWPELGCPILALASDVVRMQASSQTIFASGVERLLEAITALLQAMDYPNPNQLAASMLSEMVGAMVIARTLADEERSASILQDARVSLKKRIGIV